MAEAEQRFKTTLWQPEGATGYSVRLPFDPREVFGKVRVPVRVTIKGHTFRTTISSRFGSDFFPVNKANRAASGVEPGKRFEVVLALDTEPRVVKPPADFKKALKASAKASAVWESLSYTHQREHVQHVEEAKRPETRARRIAKAVDTLAKGKARPKKAKKAKQTREKR